MKHKQWPIKFWTVIIAGLLILVAIIFIFNKQNSPQPPTDKQVKQANDNNLPPLPDQVFPPRDPKLDNEQNLIKDYLSAHLSELSPIKEVVGGKFYLTEIKFPLSSQALISYEDGHIALQAEVKYEVNPQTLKILDFKIIKEN